MIKNTAGQKIGAQLVSAADGSAFTGSVTVSVTGDAGTQATGSVGAGACTHEGNGYHTYAPAQAETNYDLVAFTFTGTGAIPVTVQVYTITGDAFARLGAPAGASIAADLLTIDNLVDDLESRLGTPSDLGGGATIAANLADIEAQTDDIGAAGAGLTAITNRLPASLVSGRIDASVGAVAADAITAAAIADVAIDAGAIAADAITAAKIAAGAIDRATFAADTGLATIRSNTAQAGATSTITLDASASATDEFYTGALIYLTGGTGAGQARVVLSYTGSSKVLTVDRSWITTPDNTSTFAIMAANLPKLASGLSTYNADLTTNGIADQVWREAIADHTGIGGSTAETLAACSTLTAAGVRSAIGLASANLDTQLSAIDDFLDTEIAAIKAKTDNLPASPAATGDIPSAGTIADAVWDEATAGHTTAGSYGDKIGAHEATILKALTTSGSTTTAVVLNATTGIDGAAPSSVDDFYNGRVLVFTSGALAGQATSISDYNGTTKTLTVVALTGAPASGVTAVIA